MSAALALRIFLNRNNTAGMRTLLHVRSTALFRMRNALFRMRNVHSTALFRMGNARRRARFFRTACRSSAQWRQRRFMSAFVL